MMKNDYFALLIADPHSDKDNFVFVEKLLLESFDVCEQLGINKLFILGDLLTDRTGQTLMVLLSLKKVFDEANKRKIKIHIIAGNHDKTNQESEASYIDVFDNYSNNLFLHSKESFVKIDDVNCYFLPYFPENGSYVKRLSNLSNIAKNKPSDANFLFTHIAVKGAKNNDGTKVENNLKPSLFKSFDKVFIGHYHDENFINPNIHYIGSMAPRNFGENEKKGFCLLSKKGVFDRYMPDFPFYLKKKLVISEIGVESIYKIAKKFREEHPNDNLRIILFGVDEEIALVEKDKIKQYNIDVKIENIRIIEAMELSKNTKNIRIEGQNLMRLFGKFCVEKNIKGQKFKLGIKYLKKNV